MKRRLVSILAAAAGVMFTVAAVMLLVTASIRVSAMAAPTWHGLAVAAELVLDVFWLLGIVYVGTRLAVLGFSNEELPSGGLANGGTLEKQAKDDGQMRIAR